jgi:hypothetical protein
MKKKIIQRALPLNTKYSLVKISYLSIEDGGGQSCENCGRLITNIATVSGGGKCYDIGTDCLETVLLNNSLLDSESHLKWLHSDRPAFAKAKSLRSKILNQTKKDPTYKAQLYAPEGSDTFGFSFSAEVTKHFIVFEEKPDGSRTAKRDENGDFITELNTYRDPRGFDFSFDTKYKELTLNYIKGLYSTHETNI